MNDEIESYDDPTEVEDDVSQSQLRDLFEHHKLTADQGQGLMRIDQYLPLMLRNVTRSKVKKAAMAGCILVNGTVVKASYKGQD